MIVCRSKDYEQMHTH